MLRLVPREERFFDLLEQAADLIAQGAQALLEMFQEFDRRGQVAEQIFLLEKASDRLTDAVVHKANETFVTPLDREDLQRLARTMDRVINYVNSAANRVQVMGLEAATPDLIEQARTLAQATAAMREAVFCLRKHPRNALEHCHQVNDIETESDRIFRQALRGLFAECPSDVGELWQRLKLKEIHERLEEAVDRCEDAADTLEGAVVKNA